MSVASRARPILRIVQRYNLVIAEWYLAKQRFATAHRYFARAAGMGDPEAAYQLGLDYNHGRGCPRSGSEAFHWFLEAAKNDHREAQFELGVSLLSNRDGEWCLGQSARWAETSSNKNGELAELLFPAGLTIPKDDLQAFEWLKKAANFGKAEAQANLGWLLLKGVGCEKDVEEARRYFLAADKEDISQASLGLAQIAKANSDFANAETQRFWLDRSAKLGNSSAAYQLALLLKNTSPTESTRTEMMRLLLFAAERSHIDAQYEYGALLLANESSQIDIEKAVTFLRNAAKVRHIRACILLGNLYSQGEKLRPDLREAAHWFRAAADAGDVNAQFQTGCFYARGEGVPRDLKHAARYFSLSANEGHATAAYNLGVFYEKGDGVERNSASALKYFQIAANGGLATAQVKLAHLLNSGEFGAKDKNAAFTLLESAIVQNNADAEVALAFLLIEQQRPENFDRVDELLGRAISKGHVGAAELMLARPITRGDRNLVGIDAVNLVAQAANEGSPRAMVLFAGELQSGRYIKADQKAAELYLSRAADLNDANANFELGVFYCKQNRHPDDLKQGLIRYMRAAELGHAVAQFNSGVMLLSGVGADRDISLATKFLTDAAAQGMTQARELLGKVNQVNETSVL